MKVINFFLYFKQVFLSENFQYFQSINPLPVTQQKESVIVVPFILANFRKPK